MDFSEEIFGPTKDFECYCGKYKKIRYKGIICDKCGVEVTQSIVRRERMAHIELAAPATHIWFLRGVPSKIGTMLDISVQNLEKVIYFSSFIVTDINEEAREQTIEQVKQEFKSKKKMIEGEKKRDLGRLKDKFADNPEGLKAEQDRMEQVAEQKLIELEEEFLSVDRDLKEMQVMKIIPELTYHEWSVKFGHIFDAGIGAEAILQLLKRVDIEGTITKLNEDLEATRSKTKHDRIMRRIKLFHSLKKTNVQPDWMVLRAIPVIPADLRPMVPLDGGRFATSDLNDLYRRVINRNNRLKRLHDLNAPEVITRNEKRMLQEAVDALMDNSARSAKTVIASTGKKRQLKSLADLLKGKQGRFRQNLLGKRVDYSGRSVIVVGPHLKISQCGIPKKMALELFKPFVISKLIQMEYVHNIRSANKFIETDRPEVWDILEEVTKPAYVLLNRAPTLHRLGIQAFQPVLIEGKAIQLHPLVCDAYNADFDGDQMAVHVPITEEAQKEANEIMLSIRNLLKPSHGGPVATPGKDIAWATYYMTMILTEPDEKKAKVFSDEDQAIYAYDVKRIGLQEWIRVRMNGEIIMTTVGRLIVNQILPEKTGYINDVIGKKEIANIVREVLEHYGQEFTSGLLDKIKDLGFHYAMLSGYSWGMSELPTIHEKDAIVKAGEEKVREIEGYFEQGLLTQSERHSKIIKVWIEAKDEIEEFSKNSLEKGSSAQTMIESGARGAWGQLTQMIGMIGMKASPSGGIIELPVKSSFKEGVDVLEFFISSHGIRKGLTDKALKTASAGYLTRRLVDVSQDVIVTEEDCHDKDGVILTQEESEEIGEPMLIRILGRFLLSDLVSADGKETYAKKGELITEDTIRAIQATGKEPKEAHVRSVMECKTIRGVCQKCYGYDLAYNKVAKLGAAVGIIAAQSIGEPGTQLTMRTFHTGGVAGKDITQGLPRVEELLEARMPKRKAIITEVAGVVEVEQAVREITMADGKKMTDTRPGQKIVRVRYNAPEETKISLGRGGKIKVEEGAKVSAGQVIGETASGDKVLAEFDGVVSKATRIIITIVHEANKIREYVIPQGYAVYVETGDNVVAGDVLTEGHLDLQALFKYKGMAEVQKYLSKEILGIYASQGQKLNNKHIEIIIRQMFSRVRITEIGDTDFLPGEIVEKPALNTEIARIGKSAKQPEYDQLLLGITKISLSTESWLSAASFQETARVLINASVTGKVDKLQGLKENVIIGRLIPAGTGFGDRSEEESEETLEEDIDQASELDETAPEVSDKESKEVTEEVTTEEKKTEKE